MDDKSLDDLAAVVAKLPEAISLEYVQRHEWLQRLIVIADEIGNRVEYPAHEWAKMHAKA